MNVMAQSLFFSTPQESVELTARLLIDEDWGKLSSYYFTDNSDQETIASLKNGSYFIRDQRPEIFHPRLDWKYKKPFHPSFKYMNHIEIGNDSVQVNIGIEIDQGNDIQQQGISSFYLIKSEKGYQFLP
ncbi:MAG: hypothetical protein C0599_09395 [Salinivirgaceae bacterium]|nr:MAG: hypothetical protein C0599_09395 [Salinivirgaceae bacterium]